MNRLAEVISTSKLRAVAARPVVDHSEIVIVIIRKWWSFSCAQSD